MDNRFFYNKLLPIFLLIGFVPVTVVGILNILSSGIGLGNALQTGGGTVVLISSAIWLYREDYPIKEE